MQSLFTPPYIQNHYIQSFDLTEATIKNLTLELLNSEDENMLLRLILASSSDPILITNKDTNIIYVNPAWEKLTGYSYEEVKDKNPRFLQSGKTPKKVYKKMWIALKKNRSFTTEEAIDRRKDGSEYQIYATFFSVRKNGNVVYYVQLQHDITKRKKLEELRKEFLSAAAHELKTPITVLKLLSQTHLIKAAQSGSDSIKISELELIDYELDRLTQLIDDILDSSRFETGKLFLHLEVINIAELLEKTVNKVQIFAKNHPIILEKLSNDLFAVADYARIEQVLLNLLSNAVKYSAIGSTITVSAKKENSHIVGVVKDQGIGIEKFEQVHIFDRYYQIMAKDHKGFGLGLYISKEIIRRHKGKIWVKSKKGKGSTFYFSLPIAH